MVDEDLSLIFSGKDRALIITPAGCGKTEMIARAVSYSSGREKKQLILTHTHAGVKSLIDRLRRLGISRRCYYVDTIAGFALHYAASYPISSGLGNDYDPILNEWDRVYEAAFGILSSPIGKRIIQASFEGLYVDEYQDCTIQQHQLILRLAEYLPCRIVGDPLQGIFDFGENKIVNWFEDVLPHFERLGNAATQWTPWRWHGKNEKMGEWLLKDVRQALLSGKPIDLMSAPVGVNYVPLGVQKQKTQHDTCLRLPRNKDDTVVAIHHWGNQAHSLAMGLMGAYTSMEEVESKDLMKWTEKLDTTEGSNRAINVLSFSAICMTKVSTELARVKSRIEKDETPSGRNLKHQDIYESLDVVARSDPKDVTPILEALNRIVRIEGRILYRRELWDDMILALEEKIGSDEGISLQKTAWEIRNSGRVRGRRVDRRVVSRTLLIKGLEFDHALVLNADELNAKELYVAMTRGSRTLTVISSAGKVLKELPPDLVPPKHNAGQKNTS